jgi:hypothetical protein
VQYSVSSMELVVAPLDASSAVSINGYPAEPAKGAKVTKTEAFAAGSSTIVPILVRVDPALGFFIGGYRVVVRRFSLAEMASFFTLASDQAAGAVVANPYGINVTLSAEYWSSSGTSIASSAISNLDFEWFYTRSDGGTNGTIEAVVVSGGSRVLRIDSLQVGTFTYFARQKESGALITPAAGLTYVVSSGAMDLRASTVYYPAEVNMEKLHYWITPRDEYGNVIKSQEGLVSVQDMNFVPAATNVYILADGTYRIEYTVSAPGEYDFVVQQKSTGYYVGARAFVLGFFPKLDDAGDFYINQVTPFTIMVSKVGVSAAKSSTDIVTVGPYYYENWNWHIFLKNQDDVFKYYDGTAIEVTFPDGQFSLANSPLVVTLNSTATVTIGDGKAGTVPMEPGTYRVQVTINKLDAFDGATNPLGLGGYLGGALANDGLFSFAVVRPVALEADALLSQLTITPGLLGTDGFVQTTFSYEVIVQAGQTAFNLTAVPLSNRAQVYIDNAPPTPQRGATNAATIALTSDTTFVRVRVVALGVVSAGSLTLLEQTYTLTVKRLTVKETMAYYTFTRTTAAATSVVTPYATPTESFAVALDTAKWEAESKTGISASATSALEFRVNIDWKGYGANPLVQRSQHSGAERGVRGDVHPRRHDGRHVHHRAPQGVHAGPRHVLHPRARQVR